MSFILFIAFYLIYSCCKISSNTPIYKLVVTNALFFTGKIKFYNENYNYEHKYDEIIQTEKNIKKPNIKPKV
jgi:hypothetical protein